MSGDCVCSRLQFHARRSVHFHAFVRSFLRQRPEIGSRLEEHPRAAGGATDLSFERIRLELKSDNDRPLSLRDCQRYVGQTSSYVAGSDKRVGVLCVLDGSRKSLTEKEKGPD